MNVNNDNDTKHTGRNCWLPVLGVTGVAFLSLAASVENLVKYMFGPGAFWLVCGTLVAFIWAVEAFCVGVKDD